jgi:hypothetical protein
MPAPLLQYLDRLLARDLEGLVREVALFPDDETLWRILPGVANSAGNLGLHVAGNLQHFVGAVLGSTGYVRHRELEFSRRSGSRAEVIEELERALAMLRQVLPTIPEERLAAPYPDAVGGFPIETGLFLVHLAGHLTFHLGQAGYLRRILTGSSESSGAIPLQPLAMAES